MAKKRDYDEDQRVNPYEQLPADEAYDSRYDDGYDDGYDEEYGDESEERGLLATTGAKVLAGVIALLVVVLIALVAAKFLMKKPSATLPDAGVKSEATQIPPEQTTAPAPIVFAPAQQTAEPAVEPAQPTNTPEPAQQPVVALTAEPTNKPEPTGTPLPIILTNTPTPSPSPTPTPTPSPTPTPKPTPKPTASPYRSWRRERPTARRTRESASANAKVKQAVKKGESVTIHEAVLDKAGKVWYALTVDDTNADGWMRDYVVDVQGNLVKPTATPKPEATPGAEDAPSEEKQEGKPTPKPTATPNAAAIGTGKTNRDANVRKIMNGKVIVQLRKNKAVDIYAVKQDKKGNVWYEVQPKGSETVGYVRDYVITLDKGVDLGGVAPAATPAPQQEEKPAQAPAPQDDLMDREVIGKAVTNRAANVRVKPLSGGKLVRQLSKGTELHILDKYEGAKKEIWYEVATASGKTHGFVRDYVVNVKEIDKSLPAKVYEAEK